MGLQIMNPPRTKGEKFDNMKLPRKGGVMMRLTSMMDDSDPILRMAGITLFNESGTY